MRKEFNPVRERLSGSRFLRLFLLLFKEKSGRRRGFFRFVKKERENGGEYSRERTNDDGNIDDDENAFESPEGGFDVDDDVRRRLFCRCIVQRENDKRALPRREHRHSSGDVGNNSNRDDSWVRFCVLREEKEEDLYRDDARGRRREERRGE